MNASHYIDERVPLMLNVPQIVLYRINSAAFSDGISQTEWVLRALEPALSRARKMNLPTVELK